MCGWRPDEVPLCSSPAFEGQQNQSFFFLFLLFFFRVVWGRQILTISLDQVCGTKQKVDAVEMQRDLQLSGIQIRCSGINVGEWPSK